MRLFLDSSALAKRHIGEQGSDRVVARLQEADEAVLSVLAAPEVVSALNRRRREGRLADAAYQARKHDLIEDIKHATVLDLTPSVVAGAISLLERFALRCSDAIHVATAIEVGPDLFLSGDHRQCEAARAEGLNVEEVG